MQKAKGKGKKAAAPPAKRQKRGGSDDEPSDGENLDSTSGEEESEEAPTALDQLGINDDVGTALRIRQSFAAQLRTAGRSSTLPNPEVPLGAHSPHHPALV